MPAKKNRVTYSMYTDEATMARLRAASAALGVPMAVITNRLVEKWLNGDLSLSNLPKCPPPHTQVKA